MKGILLLEDGTQFHGTIKGSVQETMGEVVFNTSMTGYQELLTDPSCFGQILTLTFPLVGNYGINEEDAESSKPHVKGLIVRELCETPSNFRCTKKLNDYLAENNICALEGIDTRELTKTLREKGSMRGAILTGEVSLQKIEDTLLQLKNYQLPNPVLETTVKKQETFFEETDLYPVVLYDFGYKRSLLRSLKRRKCKVTVVPATTLAKEVLELQPKGILLSNGPGNPKDCQDQIQQIQLLAKSGIPIFGVGLGHQVAALAMGGETEQLKHGHRGVNHPVKDITQDRTYITGQNHGYVVKDGSISPKVGTVSHVNINDGTIEGISYHSVPMFTVQFHPESSAGTLDTGYLFDEFVKRMEEGGKKNA